MNNYKAINDYLYFGYLPPKKLPVGLEKFGEKLLGDWNYNADDCGKLLDIVFDDTLNKFGSFTNCVIPLSGGWDSRILLGLALDRIPSKKIKTYTFGQPGQFDYEIGAKIAKEMGVDHVGINLTDVELKWDELISSVQLSRWTYVPDSYYNQLGYKMLADNNDVILSGFMGDPLTGNHFIENGLSFDDILLNFATKERKARSCDLTHFKFDPLNSLPSVVKNKVFEKAEHLDFGVRQFHCIIPIISTIKSVNTWQTDLGKTEQGAGILTPFSHPMWAKYWAKAPKETKKERVLYVEMMKKKFPKLAGLPSKNYFGASSNKGIYHYLMKKRFNLRIILNQHFPSIFYKQIKWLNYLDYQSAFIERDDYQELWNQAVEYLNENNLTPWIEFDRLEKEHNSGFADHSWALLTIIGLALNLEVEQNEQANRLHMNKI